ncbi:protein PATRONUS 2-like [Malania oleifera]|uniref:protein PATRONUS 2-like n=1 Tax=Malania oleifera TaxID=397392 RepID=UPI0025AE5AAD|nr:protein PATRONUS 2-like [Malania oleifera]XP_057953626.1 protein PATRONUS 2-like [Malania oleifera]XP_057953627.1 protein PATRONUS 2-like [Malania oleifera]
MANQCTQRQMLIQNENLGIHHKKVAADNKTKSFRTGAKKLKAGVGSRKALNDITNKSTLPQEVSSKKKNLSEEFNIAEEMILHDHKKCIEAQQAALPLGFILDTLLPGHDSVFPAEYPDPKEAKDDQDSPRCYPEPVELPMSEFSHWLHSSPEWDSPQSSPVHWDSPPTSPFAFEPVEFQLKDDNEDMFLHFPCS